MTPVANPWPFPFSLIMLAICCFRVTFSSCNFGTTSSSSIGQSLSIQSSVKKWSRSFLAWVDNIKHKSTWLLFLTRPFQIFVLFRFGGQAFNVSVDDIHYYMFTYVFDLKNIINKQLEIILNICDFHTRNQINWSTWRVCLVPVEIIGKKIQPLPAMC